MVFRMASRWAGQRLEVLVITASLVTNLFVVLTFGIVSPALAGLAVSYTIQVTVETLNSSLAELQLAVHSNCSLFTP